MTTTVLPTLTLPSPGLRRAGLAASGLAVLALGADAAAQIAGIPPILKSAGAIGYPATPAFWSGLGLVLALATALYAWPRSALFGAVLLTGYLGGAVASHVRLGEDVAGPAITSVFLAALVWGGLAMRDARVRGLVAGGVR